MLNDFEQISLDRTLSQDEIQRYIFRLVEDLNFRIRAVEDDKSSVNVEAIAEKVSASVSGKDGETYYTWIKYSPNADGSDMTNLPQADTAYIGISYNNLSPIESDDPTDYTWSRLKGEQGATGATGATGETGPAGEDGADGADGVGVTSISNQYYYSTSATELSGGGWSTDMPSYDASKYLWIRQVISYSDGTTSYTAAAHDAEFDAAIERLTSVESDVGTITVTINGIEVEVEANAINLSGLSGRVDGAESALTSLSELMTNMDGDLSGLYVRVNGIDIALEDYERYIRELREANSALTADLARRTQMLNDIITSFNNYVAEEGQYMRHGEQGLELGAANSNFKTIIDNQRMAFMDGNTVTAYVSGQMFNMNNAVVKGTLKKGGYEEQVRTDGSVYVVWTGV